MKIEIKSKFTGDVLFEHTCENNTIKLTLLAAIQARANLSYADLFYADLSGANLSYANLSDANLFGAKYKDATFLKGFLQLNGLQWPVLFFDAHIKIGCQFHSTKEWIAFDDNMISAMEERALSLWKEYKTLVLLIAEKHQGEQT